MKLAIMHEASSSHHVLAGAALRSVGEHETRIYICMGSLCLVYSLVSSVLFVLTKPSIYEHRLLQRNCPLWGGGDNKKGIVIAAGQLVR